MESVLTPTFFRFVAFSRKVWSADRTYRSLSLATIFDSRDVNTLFLIILLLSCMFLLSISVFKETREVESDRIRFSKNDFDFSSKESNNFNF